jgi:glycosyltransferase involved in cell wall biosynthesis
MIRVLLVISSNRGADEALIAGGASPCRDYLDLAVALDADVLDAGMVGNGAGKLARQSALLAWIAAQTAGRYDVIFTDNERIGAFLGILLRHRKTRPAHVMLGHHLTPWKKRPSLFLARGGIDRLIVHSAAQRRVACERLGFDADRVEVLPYQVDTHFWRPLGLPPEELVCTAGLECRDYSTLLQAAGSLPAQVRIAAASHWSRKRSRIDHEALPPNVDVRPYAYPELRQLYDRSRFVVAPLVETDFQAGITLILEAMAMAKAVIVSATRGLPRVVLGPLWAAGQVHWPNEGPSPAEANGIYVPPGDVRALRSAIQFLLAQPEATEALGRNGRVAAAQQYDTTQFVRRFSQAILRTASQEDRRSQPCSRRMKQS